MDINIRMTTAHLHDEGMINHVTAIPIPQLEGDIIIRYNPTSTLYMEKNFTREDCTCNKCGEKFEDQEKCPNCRSEDLTVIKECRVICNNSRWEFSFWHKTYNYKKEVTRKTRGIGEHIIVWEAT